MARIKKEPIKGITQVPEDKLIVIKSNPLSSLWRSELTLAEFKILDAYLARIDSHHPEKRQIAVPREEFENVFGISKFNIKELDTRLKHLVSQAVRISDGSYKRGFAWVSLFEEARVDYDEDGVQTVYLECTQKAMKYFFNCDNLGYLRYKLRSVKNIKSRYTYILFLYLEKHRGMGLEWEEKIENLKIFLNCETDEIYKEFKYFNQRILQRCQKEILEKTECRFKYEPIRKGRKVAAVRFTLETLSNIHIQKDDEDENQLTFDDFILPEKDKIDDNEKELWQEPLEVFEFTQEQYDELLSVLVTIPNFKFPQVSNSIEIMRYHYIDQKSKEIVRRNSQKPIRNKFSYLLKLMKQDAEAEA